MEGLRALRLRAAQATADERRDEADGAFAAAGRIARRLYSAKLLVFQRLQDGSYVLAHADEPPPANALSRWHAVLPRLERDLGSGSWVPGDRRGRMLLSTLGWLGVNIAYLGFATADGRTEHSLGAVCLVGSLPIAREDGAAMAELLRPALSARLDERGQADLEGRLRLRVYRLHTIFDLSRTLCSTWSAAAILRALATTLLGQLMVGHALVLRPHPSRLGRLNVKAFPNGALRRPVRSQLDRLRWSDMLAAARSARVLRDGPSGRALASARLERLYPMEAGGEVVGVVGVSRKLSRGGFTAEDDEFARTLVNHAAMALMNVKHLEATAERRRLEKELAFASTIQRALLPEGAVRKGGISVAGETLPCYEVGGDYFDVIALPRGMLLVAAGDVSGKGVPAAILMASVSATVRALAGAFTLDRPGGLARLASSINGLLLHGTARSRFVALILILIDTRSGRLRYVNAGHLPGLLVGARGRLLLSAGGVPLGLFPDASYEEATGTLHRGAAILLFTDGIAECWPDEKAAEELEAWMRRAIPADASFLLRRVREGLRARLEGAAPKDDMTLVCVSRRR